MTSIALSAKAAKLMKLCEAEGFTVSTTCFPPRLSTACVRPSA